MGGSSKRYSWQRFSTCVMARRQRAVKDFLERVLRLFPVPFAIKL
jgi:hypothetical protein